MRFVLDFLGLRQDLRERSFKPHLVQIQTLILVLDHGQNQNHRSYFFILDLSQLLFHPVFKGLSTCIYLIYKYLLKVDSELGTLVGTGEISLSLTQEMNPNSLRTSVQLHLYICHRLFVFHSLNFSVFNQEVPYCFPSCNNEILPYFPNHFISSPKEKALLLL